MSDIAETHTQHLVQGSSKLLTLLVFGALSIAVLVWSLILPVIGTLYLMGQLS